MNDTRVLKNILLGTEITDILHSAPEVIIPNNRRQVVSAIFDSDDTNTAEVIFDVKGMGPYKEVDIARCKNGIAVNFVDTYMRRRDPDAMVIADTLPTDKKTYKERFNTDFDAVRTETFEWLKQQALFVVPFYAGDKKYKYLSIALVPKEAAFFVLALADLQGFIPFDQIPSVDAQPCTTLFVAPPFRHTHFDGKQVVVHNRSATMHEVFSYNLYPGPSAKKGVYSMLLNIGEKEEKQWSTLHCSTVRVVTPYECELVIVHEGASGGGKTEMTQDPQLNLGKLTLAYNPDNEDNIVLDMGDTCELHPITDDMGLVHPCEQKGDKLRVEDAEDAWFLRVDHLTHYGSDPLLEQLCIEAPEPFVYLNIDGKAGATALLWEHTHDAPDTPCPNPRVVLPRKYVPNVENGVVSVDIRSFGVRTPRCTREEPSYGIFGILHILPPALAWLWRLVAPRGHSNPSIIASGKGLTSEGVGSYWPFAIGTRMAQANILLHQIQSTPQTGYMLVPNQFVGAYKVGFAGQWIAREYIARRGGIHYKTSQLREARCPLLGYTPESLKFNSVPIQRGLLRVHEQPEVGDSAYDYGSDELIKFFKKELAWYSNASKISSLGNTIIEICMSDGLLSDYVDAMPFSSHHLQI